MLCINVGFLFQVSQILQMFYFCYVQNEVFQVFQQCLIEGKSSLLSPVCIMLNEVLPRKLRIAQNNQKTVELNEALLIYFKWKKLFFYM